MNVRMSKRPWQILSLALVSMSAHANPDCWARLHVGEDLATGDPVDTIQGPGEFATLVDLPGAAKTDWGDAINSVEMGPAARGMFYENANFTGALQEFGPGRAVARLDEFDFDEEIESMKLECIAADGEPDADGDGYTAAVDCDDANPAVYPGALEVSFDGIDQNCAGGDATISVYMAVVKLSSGTLTVEATYTGATKHGEPLHVEGYNVMFWNTEFGPHWRLEKWGMTQAPASIRITGPEGTIEHTNITVQ